MDFFGREKKEDVVRENFVFVIKSMGLNVMESCVNIHCMCANLLVLIISISVKQKFDICTPFWAFFIFSVLQFK